MSRHNILLITHNSRLRNLLRILNPIHFAKPFRFKNCAILKLTIVHNTLEDPSFSLELIHEGELTTEKPGKQYYDKTNFPQIEKHVFSTNYDTEENNTYNIYLVRHGEGVHNTATKWTKIQAHLKSFINMEQQIKDAELTEKGKMQAQKAAETLYTNLSSNNILKIDFIFASRLRRAFETAAMFFFMLRTKIVISDEIIILPCSHELTGANDSQIFETLENRSKCIDNMFRINNTWCNKGRIENRPKSGVGPNRIINYKIDWDYFDSTFSRNSRNTERSYCTKNNMIKVLIDKIHNKNGQSNSRTLSFV